MTTLHATVGAAVVVTNAIAAVWGGIAWWTNSPSVGFWYALRAGQATVVVQVLLGFVLLSGGHEPPETLHLVYGLLPLLVALLAEGARAGAAERELGDIDFEALDEETQRDLVLQIVRRETAIMAGSAAVVVLLALRAATVAGGL